MALIESDIDLSAVDGKHETPTFALASGFVSVQANFTKVNQEAVAQVLQSADGVNFDPIIDDKKSTVKMRLHGSGSVSLNLTGVHSTLGKVVFSVVKAVGSDTALGTIDEVHVIS